MRRKSRGICLGPSSLLFLRRGLLVVGRMRLVQTDGDFTCRFGNTLCKPLAPKRDPRQCCRELAWLARKTRRTDEVKTDASQTKLEKQGRAEIIALRRHLPYQCVFLLGGMLCLKPQRVAKEAAFGNTTVNCLPPSSPRRVLSRSRTLITDVRKFGS